MLIYGWRDFYGSATHFHHSHKDIWTPENGKNFVANKNEGMYHKDTYAIIMMKHEHHCL